MITYLLDTLVDSIKTSLINKLGLDPSTEVNLDDFPELIDEIPILDSVEELTVTENGTYTGTEGVTYNPVNVNLPLGSKSVTANGTYTASDDSLQGYSEVTVDIDDTDLYRDTTDSTYESVKTLSNCGAFPMLSLKVGIEPQQDLHGYDAPWVGGAGKNKLPMTLDGMKASNTTGTWSGNTYTINGGTITVSTDDGGNVTAITVNGTFNATTEFRLTNPSNLNNNFYGYVLNGSPTYPNRDIALLVTYIEGGAWKGEQFSYNEEDITINQSFATIIFSIYVNASTSVTDKVFKPMLRLATETDSTFEPYTNICPISGQTEANVVVSPTTDAEDGTTYNIQFKDGSNPLTVYGGTLDVVSGVLTVTDANIASYNDESLPSTWISDRDVYSSGATPTTGAQVVYKLATPTTYQLTPTQVNSLLGTTNLWADTGDVGDVRYFKKVEL